VERRRAREIEICNKREIKILIPNSNYQIKINTVKIIFYLNASF
jgi:hypothetical protein